VSGTRPGPPGLHLWEATGEWVWSCEVCGRAYASTKRANAVAACRAHREHGRGCPAALADDVRTYLAGGLDLYEAAARRGVKPASLASELRRHGLHDLLAALWGGVTDPVERTVIGRDRARAATRAATRAAARRTA
jgi:hypothetical protein